MTPATLSGERMLSTGMQVMCTSAQARSAGQKHYQGFIKGFRNPSMVRGPCSGRCSAKQPNVSRPSSFVLATI